MFSVYLSICIIMRIISGIYKIVNTKNGKFYVGSSKNIIRRFGIHRSALRNKRHHSPYLQRSWNKHGEKTFKFEILHEMVNPTEQELFDAELKYITDILPHYNVGGVGGGDNLTNNPNKEDIVRRITETLRQQVADMTETERKDRWGRSGNTNGHWKGGVSTPKCNCGKQLHWGNKRCSKCSKVGTNNPFYGKTHSDNTKQKLRSNRLGKLPTNTNAIVLDGVHYVSQAEAARKLGVSIGSISNWVRGKFKRRLET